MCWIPKTVTPNMSLSARRAWIEIRRGDDAGQARGVVALRKESVDRNLAQAAVVAERAKSLSARRAWIEMTQCKL